MTDRDREKLGLAGLLEKKRAGRKISMLTAYDAAMARLLDEAGIDVLLVGDSAANVVLGYPDTIPVGMDELVLLTRAVTRAARRAVVLGDMPFGSYNASAEDAVRNATRFLKEGRADGVKLEGGGGVVRTIRALVEAGVPTVGHLGLTPQTASMLGGYRVQARTADAASRLVDDALRIEEAGAFMIVVECIPAEVAARLAARLAVPVIGIGAGPACDGQVLVLHDMLGIGAGFSPRFVKRFAALGDQVRAAAAAYRGEVEAGAFPAAEHSFAMAAEELARFEQTYPPAGGSPPGDTEARGGKKKRKGGSAR